MRGLLGRLVRVAGTGRFRFAASLASETAGAEGSSPRHREVSLVRSGKGISGRRTGGSFPFLGLLALMPGMVSSVTVASASLGRR